MKRKYFHCSECYKVYKSLIQIQRHITKKHFGHATVEDAFELKDLEYGNYVIIKKT